MKNRKKVKKTLRKAAKKVGLVHGVGLDSPKSKKRKFSDDYEEENKWWSSFCSKQRNKGNSESFFSTRASASSQSLQATNLPTQTSVDMDDNKKDDDMMIKMTARWSYLLELENTKNLNCFNHFKEKMNSEKINQINAEVNRIENYLWRYCLEVNEENYNALKNVI